MHHTPLTALAVSLALASSASPDTTPQNSATDASSESGHAAGHVIERIQGDPEIKAEYTEGVWRYDDMAIPTPLPDGYPAPTPPEVIEIKQYPIVRRAEVSGTNNGRDASRSGFWPLFIHIESRGIPMTAPVEMEIENWDADDDSKPRRWTMAFLYKSRDQGPVGEAGNVTVRDSEPITVLALGVRGPIDTQRYTPHVDTLDSWLDDNDEWERAGEPRWLGYNGPDMPRARQWGEVQIPIRKEQHDQSEDQDPEASAP